MSKSDPNKLAMAKKTTNSVYPTGTTFTGVSKVQEVGPAANHEDEIGEVKRGACATISGYLKNEKPAMIQGLFFLLLGGASEFMVPNYIGWTINYLITGCYSEVYMMCAQMFAIILFSSIAGGLRARLFNVMSDRIARDLRNEIFTKILICDTRFFDKKTNMTGALLSRLNADVEIIQNTLSTNVSMTARGVTMIIAIVVQLAAINLKLAGVTYASLLLSICAVGSFGEFMKKFERDISAKKSRMTSDAQESFTNIKTVKAFAAEESSIETFEIGNEQTYKIGMKKQLWLATFAMVNQIGQYGALAIIVYVAYDLYLADEITIGAISTYIFFTQTLIFQFWMMSFVIGNVFGIAGVNVGLNTIMDEVVEIYNDTGDIIENDDEVNGELALEDVVFSYPEKMDVVALNKVSFKVDNQKNRVIALVGTSGCGKSSCIALLQQFYNPLEGRVTFNGRDIRTLNTKWYHNQVAIVQQEPILFSDTIRNNICYGMDSIKSMSEEEILARIDEACKQASAYDFLKDTKLFPDGYETQIGSKGVSLSGGQKQRVAIARALIRRPKVLLLDEATSALDTESEFQVQTALNKLIAEGKQTVIIVAHRLSTIKDADEILVLNKGVIIERGNHDALVSQGGAYKKLVERQLVTMALEGDELAEQKEKEAILTMLTKQHSIKRAESKVKN